MVLNAFKWFLLSHGTDERLLLAEFQGVMQQTDRRVYEEATQQPQLWGMGTTLTLAYTLGRELYVFHVGDSRCYLYRQGALRQLTRDHTLVQELVRRGHLSPEEASTHKMRHVITNVVGGTEPGVQPEVHKERLEPGDVLLLCSDGLNEMVPDADIAAVLRAEPEPARACERLVAEANQRGGKDNITVIVARFDAQG
jgi:protein phosphatase